jgi:hypothetical protein
MVTTINIPSFKMQHLDIVMAILLCGAGEFITISSATVVPLMAQSSGKRRWASMESFRE